MADEVTDPHSNKEIMAVCVRFLETKNGVLCPKEAFIEFCEPPRATGEALSETILQVLQRNKLPIQNLVGQSYDTTACMSSGNKGVQGRIKQSAPMAVYSPCKSHLLNLSIASVSKIQTIRNVIDVVNSTFLYIDNSPKRQKLWLKVIADAPGSARKLLGLCKTRWVERHRSLDRFFDMYPYIVIFLDATVNPHLHDQFGTDWNWDKDSRIKAQGLLSSLENFVNLAAFVVLRSALQPLADIASKLQLRTLDVCKAYSEIDKVTSEILTMRNNIDANYDAWYKDALDIAGKIGAVEAVPRTNKRQTQRDNVPHTTPKEYYRISIAIPFLEHLSNELGTRFSDQNRQAISNILRLVPKVLVSGHHANADELAGVYESILPQASALRCELVRWNGLWLQSSALGNDSPDSLVETINRTSSERFPNIHSLLVVGCSLPVGSCEAERAFSALRRTKNYLRSSMTEERLSNLALMVIHNDIELDTDEIADRFIRAHPRRLFDASLLERLTILGRAKRLIFLVENELKTNYV